VLIRCAAVGRKSSARRAAPDGESSAFNKIEHVDLYLREVDAGELMLLIGADDGACSSCRTTSRSVK
jgi:hypothetical protein